MNLPTFEKQKRPTISLCCIAKNEGKNVKRFLESFAGAVDEVIFVDTGSEDKTKEIALTMGADVYDFKWVNDFAKARNFAFSQAKCDYIIWADLDDVLNDKEGFIQWRNFAMEFADAWFATYNYALDANGAPIISFVRERVFKRSLGAEWQFPLHEGIILKNEWVRDYAVAWSINHLRDAEDISNDKSRNIRILEEIKLKGELNPRLSFYYAKELYESQRPVEAVIAFEKALTMSLEAHDRMLAIQYGAYAAMQCADQLKDDHKEEKSRFYRKALDFCHQGIALEPNRAEFHVAAGDTYLRLNEIARAVPYYAAAKRCVNPKQAGSPYEGAIYSFVDSYGLNPTLQLAKIYLHLGNIEASRREAQEAADTWNNAEAKEVLAEIEKIKNLTNLDNNQVETEDIVFTCPPQSVYEFDEELYKTKAMGGSETALIEVAKNLKQLTGRRVIVFNMRKHDLVADSGVEYISNAKLNEYFSKYRPKVHIAWRHNIEVTRAKTYLWCHDLVCPGIEGKKNFDHILTLTPFHSDYVRAKQNVPKEKVLVTRNGIVPERFRGISALKNPNKIVWMSSPDRGLERAMFVCDEVIKDQPNIELHVYNSIEGLYKYGPQMSALADHLFKMIHARPYVKYHGFTEQSKMYNEVSDAVVWCHPCNFIETSCITAMEMLALKIFPVTRRLGGLQNTLAEAEMRGHAVMLDHDCATTDQLAAYVHEVKSAIRERKWEKISFDLEKHSWKSIAVEWVDFMDLSPEPKEMSA